MKNKHILLFPLVLLFSLVLFLIVSSPVFAATQSPQNKNNSAYPDMTNTFCQKSVNDPNCIWLYPLTAPKISPASINLNWEIEGIQNPFCAVTCSREDSGSCAGALGKKDGLFNSTIKTLSDLNFLSKEDKIGTLSSKVGDIYQAYCCERQDNPTLLKMCKPTAINGGTFKFSSKIKVIDASACEIPFSTISKDLENKNLTLITEKNFKNWTNEDDLDKVARSKGNGSGDKDDVMGTMGDIQCALCHPLSHSCEKVFFKATFTPKSYPELDKKVSDLIVDINNNHFPALAPFRIVDYTLKVNVDLSEVEPTRHMLIVVSAKKNSIVTGNNYSFDIVDPNYPDKIGSFENCQFGNVTYTYAGKSWFISGLYCSKSDYGGVILESDNLTKIIDNYNRESNLYTSLCNQPINKEKYPDLCVDRWFKITDWLKNRDNRPSFDNFSTEESPNGNCKGWAIFVDRAAYFGNFVGEDYHPDDGKIVGRDCDANHYPATKQAKATTSLQLANMLSLDKIGELVSSFINRLFKE